MKRVFLVFYFRCTFSQPILHTFLGKNYTGFLPIAARDDREDFYVLRVVGQFEDEILFHYKEDGTLLSKVSFGADRMTFYAILNADGTLYFDKVSSTEHHVLEHYDPKKHIFYQLMNKIQFNTVNENKEIKYIKQKNRLQNV